MAIIYKYLTIFSWLYSGFRDINMQLERLNHELDVSIKLEGVSINFDKFICKDNWVESNILFADKYQLYEELGADLKRISHNNEINHLTDYLPPVESEKGFKQAQVESFKTAMHQFCDEEKLAYRDITHGLYKGVFYMIELLTEIKEKVKHPQKHQYIKVWDEVCENCGYTDVKKDYERWKEECGELEFDALKSRQKLEMFNLLTSGFFRHNINPTGAEVKRCKLIISQDDLPMGTQIPENLTTECAKLEKISTLKSESMLTIDYEKLGFYIYHNYKNLKEEDLFNIVYFDQMMDLIHEDMANLKPQLAKYLKRYEENQINELSEDCKRIINTCKPFLRNEVAETLLSKYIDKLMYDPEMKAEARSKLSGQSKNKYICDMIAHLSNSFVFDIKYNADDYATALHQEMYSLEINTIKRYISESINSRKGALYIWTRKYIDEELNKGQAG